MYAKDDLDIRTRENVKNNGEVFTPTPIVDSMNDLVPLDAWKDTSFVFIEPTCGNGQFLTRIFEKRIANGLTIEEALNTLIGMDITADNIWDSHKRLFELACSYMAKNGIEKGSKEWFEQAVRIIAIVRNNIFKVEDSLKVMNDYGKGKGTLATKRFVYIDPTGNKQTIKPSDRLEKETSIKKALKEHKDKMNSHTLAPFFQ